MSFTARLTTFLVITAFTLGCGGPPAARNTQKPTLDQVRTLLAGVGTAADAQDDRALHAFFEEGSRLDSDDFGRFKASRFWTLTLGKRVKRLGPDAFQVNLSEPLQQVNNFMTIRKSVDLPLRWGPDGQLRILSAAEVGRLEKLPIPETPGGDPVVELALPDEGSSFIGTNHFASELWVTTAGDQTTFHIRFDPPLVAPGARADQPTPEGASSFAGEVRLEFLLDADDDPATGTRLDKVYEGAGGTWAERASKFKDFGIDRTLRVDGKKHAGPDGQQLWVIDVELKTYTARAEQRPEYSSVVIMTEGDTLAKNSQTDPAVRVDGDVLRFTVPTTAAAIKPGGSFRVQLPSNSTVSSSEMNRILRGKVTS